VQFDALIVGGGAAGMSAALVLGRARRDVLVLDDANPRNAVADFSHGFITRDGERPGEILASAHRDLIAYPRVRFLKAAAARAEKIGDSFFVTDASGEVHAGKRLILATGVFDELPDVPGMRERWGKSVFVCPFCDGWEVQDKVIGVYAKGRDAVELAQELRGWSSRLIVFMEREELTPDDRLWIEASNSTVKIGRLRAISAPDNTLCFADSERVRCDVLFIGAPLAQHSPLFAALGCSLDDGLIAIDKKCRTSVSGCYAAGDAVTMRHQIIIAAASGAASAITLNSELLESEATSLVERHRGV
jgi:thioredoxin reductase